MSDDLLTSKIELLHAQINNLEKSGFFTEKEMDRMATPLREELQSLQNQLPKISEIEVIDLEILTPNDQEVYL